jgi:hypothetical protein
VLGADSIERTLTTFATGFTNLHLAIKTVIRIADHNVFGDPKDYADAKALLECAAKTHSDLLHSLAALPTSCTAQEMVTILRQIRHKDLDQSSRPSKNYGRGKDHGEGMMDELHPSGDSAR